MNVMNLFCEHGIRFDHGFYLLTSGNSCCMISSVKQLGDFFIWKHQHRMTEIHCDLTRHYDFFVSSLGKKAFHRDRIIRRNHIFDSVRSDNHFFLIRKKILQSFLCEIQSDIGFFDTRICDHSGKTAFKLTDVVLVMLRNELDDIFADIYMKQLRPIL